LVRTLPIALPACYKRKIAYISQPSEQGSGTSHALARYPVPDFGAQDTVFARAFEILHDAVREHVFPAASLAVTYRGKLMALKSVGQFTYDPESPTVSPESIFDLASVSKVVATTAMAMVLYERGLLDLEMPVAAVVPEFQRAGDGGKDDRR